MPTNKQQKKHGAKGASLRTCVAGERYMRRPWKTR